MSGNDPEVIMTFSDRVAAGTAASRLQAEGIEAHVWADDAGAAFPQMDMSHGVKLVVPTADAERAQDLLALVEGGDDEDSRDGCRENGDDA